MNDKRTTVSDEELATMLAAAAKATPGPWVMIKPKGAGPFAVINPAGDAELGNWSIARQVFWKEDADFVALANPVALASILTELQHRREAEAGAPEGWVLVPREPTPEMEMSALKASRACTELPDGLKPLPHGYDGWSAAFIYRAMLAASPSSPASGVRVKALEWVQNWHSDPLTGFSTVDHINRTYTVDHDGPRFYASTNVSPSDYSGDAIGNYGTFDEAKAACQADYEARIRSALGEHP